MVEAANVRELTLPDEAVVVMHNLEADIAHLQRFLKGARIRAEDTMLMHSVLWSDLPHTLEFLGSIFARINRWKHLFRSNPRAYSGGDAIGTWDAYMGLVQQMQEDTQSAWLYRHAVFPLSPIIMEAESVGLLLHQSRIQTALDWHLTLQAETELEAQAYVGYPLNLASTADQVPRWLYEVEHIGERKRRRLDPK